MQGVVARHVIDAERTSYLANGSNLATATEQAVSLTIK